MKHYRIQWYHEDENLFRPMSIEVLVIFAEVDEGVMGGFGADSYVEGTSKSEKDKELIAAYNGEGVALFWYSDMWNIKKLNQKRKSSFATKDGWMNLLSEGAERTGGVVRDVETSYINGYRGNCCGDSKVFDGVHIRENMNSVCDRVIH